MKKSLVILSMLLFAGAGCASTATTTVTPPPVSSPSASGSTTTTVTPGTTTTTTTTVTPKPTISVMTTLDVSLSAKNFAFTPNAIAAKPGQTVRVTLSDVEGFHTFVIDGIVKQSVTTGSVVTFVAPTAPGSYPIYCDVGSHRANGMEGTLVVK